MRKNNSKLRIVLWFFIAITLTIFLVNVTIHKDSRYNLNFMPRNLINIGMQDDSNKKEINEYNIKLLDEKSIEFDLTVDDIKLLEGSNNEINIIEKCNFELKESEKLKISQDDNKVKVIRDDKNIIPIRNNINRSVEIYLPKDYNGDLRIKNSVGDIKIDTRLSLKQLETAQGVGDLKTNLPIECYMYLGKNSTGDIKIHDLTTNEYEISAAIGDIEINKLRGYGNINTSTGNIEIGIEDNKGDISLETSTGDIDVDINKKLSFNIKGKCNVGDLNTNIEFNNIRSNKKSINGSYGNNPIHQISLETSVGDLEINSK